MTLDDYSKRAASTMVFSGSQSDRLNYASIALGGEVGEYLNEYKKWLRTGTITPKGERLTNMLHELGDILYYLDRVSVELGSNLETVARLNNAKLAARYGKVG